nr:unnamed protein product [Callosobruchus chinensis]
MVSKLVRTKDGLKQYITYLKKIIILLEKCITDRLECVGNFSKIESDLAVLKVYLSKFKRKLNKRKSSNRKRIKSGIITNINVKDLILFLEKAFRSFSVHIRKQLKHSVIKVNVVFAGVFIKPQNAETSIKHFVTKNEIIDNNTNLKEWYKRYVNDKILVKFEEFQEKASGWALLEILHLKVNINEYNPIGVGVSTFIDLPPFVRNSKSVINIENNDPYCFLWSVVCALYPAPKDKNVSRVSSYPHFSKVLKLGNIKFPITLKDIPNSPRINLLMLSSYYLKCSYDDSLSKFRLYTGRDCQDWFAKELHRTALELNYIFKNPKPMTPLDSGERQCFSSALTCHICERPFDSSNSDKVMDHDHFTGKFRGAAHNGCNLIIIASHTLSLWYFII